MISPRRSRLTGVCGFHVLKTASARWSDRPCRGQLPGDLGACRGVRGIDVDGHDRAHHVFKVVNRAHGARAGRSLTTSRHWKPSV